MNMDLQQCTPESPGYKLRLFAENNVNHVKWVSCNHGVMRPQETASTAGGLGGGLTTHCKNYHVTKCYTGLRILPRIGASGGLL
jgi:hypothetical protein